jgi:hypothetical protein
VTFLSCFSHGQTATVWGKCGRCPPTLSYRMDPPEAVPTVRPPLCGGNAAVAPPPFRTVWIRLRLSPRSYLHCVGEMRPLPPPPFRTVWIRLDEILYTFSQGFHKD